MLNLDARLKNADWTKEEWNLPPYKSDEFYEEIEKAGLTLEDFKRLPKYEFAVEQGLIEDDEWAGKSLQEQDIFDELIIKGDSKDDAIFDGLIVKGGSGSGNWGHQGLPGQMGGSSETGGVSEEFNEIPNEVRYSFDPESADFDFNRHSKHCEKLDYDAQEGYTKEVYEYAQENDIEIQEPIDILHGNNIIYHGRRGEDHTFDRAPAFFAKDPTAAQFYAEERGERDQEPMISSVEVDYDSPADESALFEAAREQGIEFQTEPYFEAPEIAEDSPYGGTNPNDLVYIPEVREALQEAGYDAFEGYDILTNREVEIVIAFDPDDIEVEKVGTAQGLS